MSKFDEILNSSDASDALLGEQIDKIEQKKLDKGYTWAKLGTTFTLRQTGNVVVANGYIQNINATANTQTTIGHIPSDIGYPIEAVRSICSIGDNAYTLGTLAYLTVATNGDVIIKCPESKTNASVFVNFCYNTAD